LKRTSNLFARGPRSGPGQLCCGDAPCAGCRHPQHHDQLPGFYRTKVGDFEVTALYDGAAQFDLNWLTAKKATLNGVAKALHADPHLLDTGDTGFLVNTGKEVILIDAGAGTWFGGGNSRSFGE